MNAASRLALPAPWTAKLGALRARWRTLSARDRSLAGLAAAVLGAFLLWSVAIQPAWRTLREAPAQREALDAQWQSMQALAAEARQLRDAPVLSAEQAAAALRAASDRLGGKARLSLQGDRAVLTLNGVSSTQLREWLAEARAGARARPVEAQLSRGAQGFSGSLVLQIGVGGP
jgi:general secretion pathway protein M